MTGWLAVAGLGPGADNLVTPEVSAVLAEATDIVGYIPYVARVAARPGLTLHPSDNRVELDRARAALDMAAAGGRVVMAGARLRLERLSMEVFMVCVGTLCLM